MVTRLLTFWIYDVTAHRDRCVNTGGIRPDGQARIPPGRPAPGDHRGAELRADPVVSGKRVPRNRPLLGASAVAKPTFDVTAGGTLDPFNDYPTFLVLSQGVEDTGVRAYKGQAAALMSDNALLTTALRTHSVEALHVSEVRRLRGQKGWITGNTTDPDAAAIAAVYAGGEATNGAATGNAATEARYAAYAARDLPPGPEAPPPGLVARGRKCRPR